MKNLLKAKDIAERLGVSRSQAFVLMRSEIPTIRFGRCVRVSVDDLDAFIEKNSSHATKNILVVSATSMSKHVTPTAKGNHNV